MAACRTPTCDELAATIAVARLLLGPGVRIQAPPNLVGDEYELMLARASTTGAASRR